MITTAPSPNEKGDNIVGDIMEKLRILTSRKQVKVCTSMIPFFVLLKKSNEGKDDEGKTYKDLKVHCFLVNTNPINGKRIYE